MVHLTLEALQRGFATHNQPQDAGHLRKITHLQISGREIESVDPDAFAACHSLSVVYLYDNRLEAIPTFRQPYGLSITNLYLQNNSITRITGMDVLKCLVKLFLGGNQLTVVEGLEQCTQLEELHIERQRLPSGHRLVFDPKTVSSLTQCLQILDISGNKISTLVAIAPLSHLRELISTANLVEDFRETGAMLENSWRKLEVLDLTGNPICSRNKYRERIIFLASPSLKQLDGKEVTEAQRKFVLGWHQAARGKSNEEKPKTVDKAWSRDTKGSFYGQTPSNGQIQSDSFRPLPEPLLSSNSSYVIPAMPLRNAIKHQPQKVGKGLPPPAPNHFGRDFLVPEKANDIGIEELTRRLQLNDLGSSLSAKG